MPGDEPRDQFRHDDPSHDDPSHDQSRHDRSRHHDGTPAVGAIPSDAQASAPPPPPVPPYVGATPSAYGTAASYGPTPGYGPAAIPNTPAPAYAPPAGYVRPAQGYGPYVPQQSAPPSSGGAGLGVIAFVLALVAAVGASIAGAVAAFNIGMGTGRGIALQPTSTDFDWSILAPVREWVLFGEIAFWVGTVLGTWALVQGIVATVKNRGRGWGIAAIIIAVIGPVAFAIGLQAFAVLGLASGAAVNG